MVSYYEEIDNSGLADPHVSFKSSVLPVGVLVHTTAGSNSLDWLLGGSYVAGAPASADYLIDRDGTRHKLCPAGRRPYHAGKSWCRIYGTELQNDLVSASLLGVELEQIGFQDVTYAQIDSLAELIVLHGIGSLWRWPYLLLGHYDVAIPQGRRSDPQNFDWGSFMGRLYHWSYAYEVPGLWIET